MTKPDYGHSMHGPAPARPKPRTRQEQRNKIRRAKELGHHASVFLRAERFCNHFHTARLRTETLCGIRARIRAGRVFHRPRQRSAAAFSSLTVSRRYFQMQFLSLKAARKMCLVSFCACWIGAFALALCCALYLLFLAQPTLSLGAAVAHCSQQVDRAGR